MRIYYTSSEIIKRENECGFGFDCEYELFRDFEISFHFINWTHLSLGIHLDLKEKHFQLHVPSGFLTIGFTRRYVPVP